MLQADDRPLGEEREMVTVVFGDHIGFTSRAERPDPEDVRGLLSCYQTRVHAVSFCRSEGTTRYVRRSESPPAAAS